MIKEQYTIVKYYLLKLPLSTRCFNNTCIAIFPGRHKPYPSIDTCESPNVNSNINIYEFWQHICHKFTIAMLYNIQTLSYSQTSQRSVSYQPMWPPILASRARKQGGIWLAYKTEPSNQRTAYKDIKRVRILWQFQAFSYSEHNIDFNVWNVHFNWNITVWDLLKSSFSVNVCKQFNSRLKHACDFNTFAFYLIDNCQQF